MSPMHNLQYSVTVFQLSCATSYTVYNNVFPTPKDVEGSYFDPLNYCEKGQLTILETQFPIAWVVKGLTTYWGSLVHTIFRLEGEKSTAKINIKGTYPINKVRIRGRLSIVGYPLLIIPITVWPSAETNHARHYYSSYSIYPFNDLYYTQPFFVAWPGKQFY